MTISISRPKASDAAERATKRQKIMEAIEAKEREGLQSASLDELKLQLAALIDGRLAPAVATTALAAPSQQVLEVKA